LVRDGGRRAAGVDNLLDVRAQCLGVGAEGVENGLLLGRLAGDEGAGHVGAHTLARPVGTGLRGLDRLRVVDPGTRRIERLRAPDADQAGDQDESDPGDRDRKKFAGNSESHRRSLNSRWCSCHRRRPSSSECARRVGTRDTVRLPSHGARSAYRTRGASDR
jgi:hypothetical protein